MLATTLISALVLVVSIAMLAVITGNAQQLKIVGLIFILVPLVVANVYVQLERAAEHWRNR